MDTSSLMDMDRDQLEKLRADIDKQLENLEAQRKQDAIAALKKIEEEYGYSIDDLKSGRGGSASKGVPKFADPNDATKTWTGRGRKPRWVLAHLDKGGSLKDLEIG